MNTLEHHLKIGQTIILKIEGTPLIDDNIKRLNDNTFKVPDKPGIYYIEDLRKDDRFLHKLIVHRSPILVYYDDSFVIVGYYYNNQYYTQDGMVANFNPGIFNPWLYEYLEIPYLGFDSYHIILPPHNILGNTNTPNYPGVLVVDKVLGNITIPKSIKIQITYHPTRLISYSYNDTSLKLAADMPGSQIIQAILPVFNIRMTYLFYSYQNKVIFQCDDKYYDLDGYYLIINPDHPKFLFSINI